MHRLLSCVLLLCLLSLGVCLPMVPGVSFSAIPASFWASGLPATSGVAFAQAPLSLAETLSLLEAHTAKVSTLQSDFVQTTSIPLLDEPIVSRGRFIFVAPAKLRWEQTSPVQEGFILTPASFMRWENGIANITTTKPSQDPLGMFLARQLIAWVTFDVAVIGAEYDIAVASQSPLSLRLVPKKAQTREVMRSLSITFTPQGTASLVVLEESNGGTTSLVFENTQINQLIAPAEFRE